MNKRSYIYSQLSRPLANGLGFSVMSKIDNSSTVVRLFSWRRPFAVLGFIYSIIVNSFYRSTCKRFWTHVVIEILKGIHPSFADFYSSCSIVLVSSTIRIKTSVFHALPTGIFSAFVHVVCCRRATNATRLDSSFSEMVYSHRLYRPTFTLAHPIGCTPFTVSGNNSQLPIDISCLIFESWCVLCRMFLSHLNLLDRFMVVRATQEVNTPAWFVHFGPSNLTCQCEGA